MQAAKYNSKLIIMNLEEAEKEEAEDEEDEEEEEEKKEKELKKALKEIKESEETPEVEGTVISEGAEEHVKIRAFSVFASQPIVESKKARKAYSVFAD